MARLEDAGYPVGHATTEEANARRAFLTLIGLLLAGWRELRTPARQDLK